MTFSTLGHLLNYLKTKQIEDMNDEMWNHLEQLWEEANSFGFNLGWVEGNVKCALDMKN